MIRHRHSRIPAGLFPAFMAAMLLLWTGAPLAAHATTGEHEPMLAVPENGLSGLLSLTSSVFPLAVPWLEPGETFTWQVGLHLKDQPVAGGSLEFLPYGGLVQPDARYALTAQRCDTQWSGTSGPGSVLRCASGATTLLSNVPLQQGPPPPVPVGNVTAGTSPHILFTMSLPEGAAAVDPFNFALGITVMGDDVPTAGDLPDTGLAATGVLTTAALLLAAGLSAKVAGRRAAGR